MVKATWSRFRVKLRKSFFAGLMVLIPLYFTVYVLEVILSIGDRIVHLIPSPLRPPEDWMFPGAGLLLATVIAIVAGLIVRNVVGNFLYGYFNRLVERIPVVASLYGLFRQIAEVFLGGNHSAFKQVVLIEWPRKGMWTFAFVSAEATGVLRESLKNHTGDSEWVNVFIPTTPNPTSGFYSIVAKKELIYVDITVERAFKTIVSGGSLAPDHATGDDAAKFLATSQHMRKF
jgi:uncharacterized membrane protein